MCSASNTDRSVVCVETLYQLDSFTWPTNCLINGKNIGCGRLKILPKGRNSGKITEILTQDVRQGLVLGAMNAHGGPTVLVDGKLRERRP